MSKHLFSRGTVVKAACLFAVALGTLGNVQPVQAQCRSPHCRCQSSTRGFVRYVNAQSFSRPLGTGVFVNGRELSRGEVFQLQGIFGRVIPGSYWRDEYGNYGFVGCGRMGNLYDAMLNARFGGGQSRILTTRDLLQTGIPTFR